MANRTPPNPKRRSPLALVATVAAVAVVVVVFLATRGGGEALTTVSVRDLQSALAQDPAPTLIDVREPSEYADGHVEGALLMPLANVVQLAVDLPKDEPVYVFCRTGNRSLQASQALVAAGFEDVRNVDGGIVAWTSAGLPVVR